MQDKKSIVSFLELSDIKVIFYQTIRYEWSQRRPKGKKTLSAEPVIIKSFVLFQ